MTYYHSIKRFKIGWNHILKNSSFYCTVDIRFIDLEDVLIIAEAKQMGMGDVVHHPIFSDTDLK